MSGVLSSIGWSEAANRSKSFRHFATRFRRSNSAASAFQHMNDLRVQAAALFFGGTLERPVDFIGHVLERDIHATILDYDWC